MCNKAISNYIILFFILIFYTLVLEVCSLCGGKVKVLAVIEEPQVIEKILKHLRLDPVPPQIWPARGPPQQEHILSV